MATTARRIQNSEGATRRDVARPAWSPAQIVTVIVGLFLVVLGAIGLAHTGFTFSNIPVTRVRVMDLPVTSLAALAELIAGVLVLAGSAAPGAAKGTSALIGVVALAWGLIVAIDPTPFVRLWAYDRADGVLYTVVGAVLLITAAVSPIFLSRRDVTVIESNAQAEDVAAPVN
ncbi:MAG TPA: hypothetical protein VGP46_01110 [Acidimicrobiales bacterium]|nr:hypothetical protein [Acidimicrobiales bacterium]